MSRHSRSVSFAVLVLATVLLLGAGCARYPRDPQRTLEQVFAGNTLHVGVVHHPPWVTGQSPDVPGGPEEELIAGFAGELGVEADWRWGSSEELFEALAHYELDLVIGGIKKSNPWRKHVAFTVPYFTSHVIVGVPRTEPALSDLNGVTVTVRPQSGLQEILKRHGATIMAREKLVGVEGPVAAEEWEITGMEFRPTNIRLQKVQRVMAVPPGENAMAMRLEDFLLEQADAVQIADLLWEASK